MLIGAGARDRDEAIVYSYTSQDGTDWEPAGEFDTGGVEMPGQYWELPILIEISIPPFASLDIEILIDGAAIFGSLNGRPIAFLAFATAPGRNGLRLAVENGTVIGEFEILSRENDQP